MTTSSTLLRRCLPVALLLTVTACGTATPGPGATPVGSPPTATAAPVTTTPAATGPVDVTTAQQNPCRLIRPDQYPTVGVSPSMPPRTSTAGDTPLCSWFGNSTVAGVTTLPFDTAAYRALIAAEPVDVGGLQALRYVKEKSGIVVLVLGGDRAILVTATALSGDTTASLAAATTIAGAVADNLAG